MVPVREVLIAFSVPFGLILGSFLNVCIFRIPRECMSILHPRSRCIRCLRPIRWYENVPVISYLFLRGRCAGCGSPISLRYPAVELLTGAIVVGIAWIHLYGPAAELDPFDGTVLFLARVYVSCVLVACTFIDFQFRILPNVLTYSGIAAGLVFGAAFPVLHAHEGWAFEVFGAAGLGEHLGSAAAAVLGGATGAGVIIFVRTVGAWVFRKEAMGQGDIYYMGFIGAFLGWKGVLLTFVIACLAGSIYGITHYLITRDRYLPFGPFLSIGAFVMMLFHEQVEWLMAWYQGLFVPGP